LGCAAWFVFEDDSNVAVLAMRYPLEDGYHMGSGTSIGE